MLILGSLLFLPGDTGRVASAALSLFGFMYSAYLTYRELFSIDAICQWCVMSAIIAHAPGDRHDLAAARVADAGGGVGRR